MADEEKKELEYEPVDDPGEFDIQDDDEIEGISFSDDITDVTGIDFEQMDELPMGSRGGNKAPEKAHEEETDPSLNKDPNADVSFLNMLAHAFLFTIPVVGVVFMVTYIADGDRNIHLRKLAGIWMVLLLLAMTALCVAVVLLGQAGTIPGLPIQ